MKFKQLSRAIGVTLMAIICIASQSCGASSADESEKDAMVTITPSFVKAVHVYDELFPFSEGLAAVKKDGKYGFIDTTGELVIPCTLFGVGAFSEGLACVYDKDHNISFINRKGETVLTTDVKFTFGVETFGQNPLGIPNPYLMDFRSIEFKNGICRIEVKTGSEPSDTEYVYIDKNGKRVDKPQDNQANASESSDLYEIFTKETPRGFMNGLKDKNGKVLIDAKYTVLSLPSNGVCYARITEFGNYESNIDRINALDRGEEIFRTVYGYVDLKGNSTFTDNDFKKIDDYRGEQMRAKNDMEWQLRHEQEQSEREESSHNQQSQDNSLPSWMQGVWHGSVGGPNGMLISSYTVTISGNNAIFREDGRTVYDGACYIDGNSLRLGSVASLDIRDNALCYNLKRMTKEGGSSASSSGVNGATTFRTSTDVMDYLTRHVFYNGNQRLVIMFNTITLNAQPITGAPRVVNFSNQTATIIANAPTGERFTFYLNAGNGTLSQAGTVFQAR